MMRLWFIVVLMLGIAIGFLIKAFEGPSYSQSHPEVVPWPLFKIGLKVNKFLHDAYLSTFPPNAFFQNYNAAYIHSFAIYVVAKLGVADHMAEDSAVHYEDLAKRVGAHPRKLFQIMRFLSSEGIFSMQADGTFTLTKLGKTLRTDEPFSTRWCSIMFGEEPLDAQRNMLHEVKTGEEAHHKTWGDTEDYFSILSKNPKSAEVFTKCMKTVHHEFNLAISLEYDFSAHHTLLDLGGGMGWTADQIFKIHGKYAKPDSNLTSIIVLDLEKVVASADLKTEGLSYVVGDFFEPSTIPQNADLILLHGVIHDWSDEEAVEILKNARNALPLSPNARIIVADNAIPVDRSHPFYGPIAGMDVFMATLTSGTYRTHPEYNNLWTEADLKLVETRDTRSIETLWILSK
jgi:C-methyltransferase